eukprot:Nitzschia sp. Nitz4//scaffold54_size114964//11395//11955//NITZ4_003834-RA/size114964-processed-gene-0.175-mRNA-1//-1//CDS//3329554300//1582//frame0
MKRGEGPSTARIHVKLLEDVAGQGYKDDILHVRPSFFANYLHPTKKAVRLNKPQLEVANKMLVRKQEHFQEQVQKWADWISTLQLVFEREAHENGMIPQDMEISKSDLASSLVATIGQLAGEQSDLDLKVLSRLGQVSISQVYNRRNVMMRMNPRGIRYLGPYRATVNLHGPVAAEFKIEVKRRGT